MSEEEIINRLNSIIKEWQEIVNIKDKQEREIEMSMYIEDMPFYEIQGLLDLYNKEKEKNEGLQELYTGVLQDWSREKEKNKELERYKKYYQNERNLLDSYISKDKVKIFFEERLLKYAEADDGKYDKPYLTRGELELVDRYGECKEIAELLLAEKIELPKECISKDKIKQRIKELEEMRDDHADEIKRNVRFYSIYDSYNLQIAELQDLLEEG